MTTEAGRALHDMRHLVEYCEDPCELREEIAAIEAEALSALLAELKEEILALHVGPGEITDNMPLRFAHDQALTLVLDLIEKKASKR